MTITVTDPDTALDGLRGQVDQLLGMARPNGPWTTWNARRWTCPPRVCGSPGLVDRAACPQISPLATTCHTLALAFDVRGGSHDDHCHRAGHGVDRSATR